MLKLFLTGLGLVFLFVVGSNCGFIPEGTALGSVVALVAVLGFVLVVSTSVAWLMMKIKPRQ